MFTFSLCLAAFLVATPALSGVSLWKAKKNEKSMFADRVADQVGDIVTVLVSESSSQTASISKNTEKETNVSNGITSFLFPSTTMLTREGELPGFQWGSGSEFSGGGDISNRQSVTARFACQVIDRLPNGVLVIEGARLVAYSGERRFVVLRGLVRPDDISAGNTILSSDIADARVEFISEGSLTEVQRKGWLTKIHDVLNPF